MSGAKPQVTSRVCRKFIATLFLTCPPTQRNWDARGTGGFDSHAEHKNNRISCGRLRRPLAGLTGGLVGNNVGISVRSARTGGSEPSGSRNAETPGRRAPWGLCNAPDRIELRAAFGRPRSSRGPTIPETTGSVLHPSARTRGFEPVTFGSGGYSRPLPDTDKRHSRRFFFRLRQPTPADADGFRHHCRHRVLSGADVSTGPVSNARCSGSKLSLSALCKCPEVIKDLLRVIE
jgi:hypothetical protein